MMFAKNGKSNGIFREKSERKAGGYGISESRLAIFGLVLSISVILVKVVHLWRDSLYNILFEQKLITYNVLTENGEVFFTHTWKTAGKYSAIWLPPLCGLLVTWFTWLMVYVDSSVPGVHPPSPLSPTKYKYRSGPAFHLNYIFAILAGVMVTFYLYSERVRILF